MTTRILPAVAAAITLSLSLPAAAESLGAYVVAFGGQSSIDTVKKDVIDESIVLGLDEVGLAVTDGSSSLDDSDVAYGLALGYKLNQYFAAEIAYVDLGAASYKATGEVTDGLDVVDLAVRAEASAKGPVASLLFFWPVHERFSPYLRAGLALMETRAKVSASVTFDGEDVGQSLSDSTTRSNTLLGVGVDYAFSDRFGIRAEWTRYYDVGSEDVTGEGDIDTILAGIRWQF
jgi:opacity protein-like surface antigen